MSLNFGQKRKDNYASNNFLTLIQGVSSNIPFTGNERKKYIQNTSATIGQDINLSFSDTVIKLENNNNLFLNSNYFLRIKFGGNTVKNTHLDENNKPITTQYLNFTLALQNNSEYQQIVGSYSINISNREYYYDCIFSPNAQYDRIVIRLTRSNSGYDFNSNVTNRFYNVYDGSRFFPLLSYNLYNITNILTSDANDSSIASPLKRIGVEGDVGLIMCINGEGIRIPPSGIFQINRDTYPIDFLGFAILPDSSESFILNYQY